MQRVAYLWVVTLLLVAPVADAKGKDPAPGIHITRAGGRVVPQLPEDTNGIFGRPVNKTRDRVHDRYDRELLYLYQIEVDDGEHLKGTYQVGDAPLRITLYEIRKSPAQERTLRVIGSQYYEAGALAEWETTIEKREEHVFIVTAEKTKGPEELNQHLTYMNQQDNNEILLKGFSSNWNLTKLKFKMAENGPNGEVPFAKDGEWLIDKLIDPAWVCSIRVM